ncbi:cdc42 effector protein 1-like [Leucoraja erinacea]|uniref:cdc42 effector protein 1-like n=1 Tax=Leucoraja erinaceus TaxID=7782 RepID=UPI00245723FC|nr:cdc42 effector protein 1-like [Leucoraja erinacea]
MSLGKLPIFRNLVPGHHKRRLKPDLTTDMISSPMGDFRHTMHVGRGGDVFGDTSFLSDHGGEGAREGASSNRLVRALRNARRAPARNSSPDVAPPPPVSPIIKNAVSLPHLLDTDNGTGVQRLNFKTAMSSPGIMDGSYGLESGFCTLPRWSRMEKSKEREAKVELVKATEEMEVMDFQLPRTDSMMSFSLDLGPSLLSEVLAVMGSRGEQTPEKESPSGRENGMRLVKFQLEGPPDQLDGEGSRPTVTSLSGLRGRFQPEAWMDAPTGEEERPSLGPAAASAVYGRATPGERRGASQTRRDGPTPAAEPSLGLGVHLASSGERDARGRWGSTRGSEADGDGSWRPPRPRVPADGEEAALGHAERPWDGGPSAAQETGFNPLKAEAFAFADEDEEIRV